MKRIAARLACLLSAPLFVSGCMALGNVSASPTEYYGGTATAVDVVFGHGVDPYPWFTGVVALPLEPVVDTLCLPVVAYRRATDDSAAPERLMRSDGSYED